MGEKKRFSLKENGIIREKSRLAFEVTCIDKPEDYFYCFEYYAKEAVGLILIGFYEKERGKGMHIAIEGLDGAGKTSAAKGLARELGYVFQECPIYELVSRQGVEHFYKNLKQMEGNLHMDIAAMFFGVGNLYLRQLAKEKNVVTDRHLCATYLWNINENNMPIFDFLVETSGKPDLTIILYAEALVRKKRIIGRNPYDSDLDENIFTDEKYEKALEFVNRYNMKYVWLDNTYLNIQQTVAEIKRACYELPSLVL